MGRVDPGLERALRAIDAATVEFARLLGPLPLSEAYLPVEWVEALPGNQPGADKTWLWPSSERDRLHFARARR